MHKVIFFKGIDDTNSATVFKIKESNSTSYRVNLSGMTPLDELFKTYPDLSSSRIDFIIGINKSLKLNDPSNNYLIFNQIGSEDACSVSLNTLASITTKNTFKGIINKPEKVALTSRAQLPKTLSHIEGIKVAQVNTLKVSSIDELAKNINKYPVIIRKKGFHNGKFCNLIPCKESLNQIQEFISEKAQIQVIEFINTFDKSLSLYKKARIAVINGKFYPQHLLFSENWMVHSRREIMTEREDLRVLEHTFLRNFDHFLEKHKSKLDEIHRRIGLEYYGIDCIEDENGDLVIFEANACMDLLSAWYGNCGEFNYKKPYRQQAKEALKNLIEANLE